MWMCGALWGHTGTGRERPLKGQNYSRGPSWRQWPQTDLTEKVEGGMSNLQSRQSHIRPGDPQGQVHAHGPGEAKQRDGPAEKDLGPESYSGDDRHTQRDRGTREASSARAACPGQRPEPGWPLRVQSERSTHLGTFQVPCGHTWAGEMENMPVPTERAWTALGRGQGQRPHQEAGSAPQDSTRKVGRSTRLAEPTGWGGLCCPARPAAGPEWASFKPPSCGLHPM